MSQSPDLELWASRATWCLVAAGITIRLLRFLLRFPLWGDERLLAESFINHDLASLSQPLDHGQVAPLGYLWVEWCSTRLLGFNEWSLRLPALLGGIAGLLSLRQLATRWLSPLAAVLTVGFLAIGYYPIRHAVEVKPYAIDLGIAATLLWLASGWLTQSGRRAWLWALAALAGPAMLLSFPAVFVVGGVGLTTGMAALIRREWKALIPLAVYGLLAGASFGVIYWHSTSGQFHAHQGYMQSYWADGFPPSPLADPLAWGKWMLQTHTGEMFAYPFGAENYGSSGTTLLCLVGAVVLMRRKQWWFIGAVLGTFGLAYVAATLQRYPYGGHPRVVQYLGPMICVLGGVGGATLLGLLRGTAQRRVSTAVVGLLLIAGTGIAVRDLVRPYKDRCDWDHQGFARWFWNQDGDGGEQFCAERDLGVRFYSQSYPEYTCFRQIYTRRGAKPEATTPESLPGDKPIRVVVYGHSTERPDPQLWQRWLSSMQMRYNLVAREEQRVLVIPNNYDLHGVYTVYHFAPKTSSAVAPAPNTATRPRTTR